MRLLAWLLLTLLSPFLVAQGNWEVETVDLPVQENGHHASLARSLRKVKDSAQAVSLLNNWALDLAENGYLQAQWQDLVYERGALRVTLDPGPYYQLESLLLTGLPEAFWEQTALDRLVKGKETFSWQGLQTKLDLCTQLFQNEGYPFARFDQLSLEYLSRGIDTVALDIAYQFDPGPLITVDSIYIKGNPREKDRFIYALTRFFPGDPYNQKRIDEIPRILNNSIYYEQVKSPEISFTAYETAQMTLEMARKKAGKFDILLGILPPQNSQIAGSQRLQFTGTVDILLVSPLKQGEVIQLKYDKLTSTSQQTEVNLLLPFLFRTPLRLEAEANLLKQEEDFLNINAQTSGSYAFSPFLSARFYYRLRDTRLIGAALNDTTLLDFDQLDGNRQLFGVGFAYQNLDYRFNPSEGWDAHLEIGLGRKEVRENVRLRPEVYDDVTLSQSTQEIDLRLKWYYSPVPRHVIHLGNHTYWLGMDQILRNDQLQVGGARSIRGFNENAFFTDFYSFFTAEYRLQLERNSFLFGFADYAWLRDRAQDQLLHPFGFGIGMNYGTQAGIVSISYAIGRVEGTALQPTRGRIHIGLVNQF
jgi:translocation and assembly module TamA